MMKIGEISEAMMRGAVEPMSEEMSRLFLTLCLSEQTVTKEKNKELGGIYKILKGRTNVQEGEVTEAVYAFVTFLTKGVAGRAVMYAAFLNAMVKKHSKVDMWCLADCFPMGFPTEESISKIWKLQKSGNQNSVDMQEAWN